MLATKRRYWAAAVAAAMMMVSSCTYYRAGDVTFCQVGGRATMQRADVSIACDNVESFKDLNKTITGFSAQYFAWKALEGAQGIDIAKEGTSRHATSTAAGVEKARIGADVQKASIAADLEKALAP